MRYNGVNVPTPNTSGNGPVFSTKGINTAGAQFRAAEAKCRSSLAGTFEAAQVRAPQAGPEAPEAQEGHRRGPKQPAESRRLADRGPPRSGHRAAFDERGPI